jgi:GPH family glycoside/pentoside/hexuronide:cation symporter
MLVGGPLVALSIGLLFSPPAGLPPMGLLAWLVTMTLVLRFAVSAFHVPYLALGAELSEDYAERSSIVAYRTIFYVVGPLLILGLAYGVFFAGPLSLRNPLGYPRVGWASAAIILVGAVVSVLGVRRFAAGLTVAAASTSPLHVRMAGELAEIFRNPSFRVLFGCSVLFWAAQGVAGSLNQYLNVFVWHINSSEIFLITMGFFVGVIVGVPLGPFLSRRFEKRIVSALGFGILLVAQGDLTGLRALGVFTATGAAATLPILINTLVAGVGVAFASIAIGSMMADAADEHDFLFGARREGLYFAGLGFAGKAATGIGSVVGGIAIDLIGFPKGAAASNVALHLPETMLTNLSIAGGPVVSLLSLAAVSLLMFYRIDRRRHAEIVEALRLRREAAA